jgi:hypothetical protein
MTQPYIHPAPTFSHTYRKKPVEVEAVEVDQIIRDAGNNWSGLPNWIVESYDAGNILFGANEVYIRSIGGTMKGSRGDWIIHNVHGEIYPCKPDIFAGTYDKVD